MIVDPCPRSFDALEGDGAVRYCDRCGLHVADAARLGRVAAVLSRCVRLVVLSALGAAPAAATPPAPGPDAPKVVVVLGGVGNVREQVRFAAGDAAVPEPALALLDEVAAILAQHPEIRRVAVQGHTDPTESGADLARSRAEAVTEALVARGVPRERLVVQSHGAERPIAPNASPEGRAKNRRVEFEILP